MAAGRLVWAHVLAVTVTCIVGISPAAASFGVVDKWGQFGVPPSLYKPQGVALDTSGNAYVADTELDVVVKFDSSGNAVSTFGAGVMNEPQGVAVDSTAGTVYVADRFGNQVERFTSAGVRLTPWSAGGPSGVALDAAGNVYVSEATNSRIVKLSASGTVLGTIGSLGSGDGQLWAPEALALDGSGDIYVADTKNNRIEEFDSSGSYLQQWSVTAPRAIGVTGTAVYVGRSGALDGFTLAGSLTTHWTSTSAGTFGSIQGLALSGSNVVVTQPTKPQVLTVAPDGSLAATWTFDGLGNGEAAFRGALGTAVAPATGDVYVVDQSNRRVQHFTSSGTFVGQWGTLGGGDGQFQVPYGVTVTSGGDVFVTDTGLDRVQRFSSDGSFVSVVATGGSGPGQVSSPVDVDAAPDGSIYVAEYGNQRIQHLSATGTFLDSFVLPSRPAALGVAPNGDIYVAYQSASVDRFSSAGVLLGTIGGAAAPFSIGVASDVAVSPAGDYVYIVDYSADKVVRATPAGAFVEAFGSSGSGDGSFDYPRAISASADGYIYVSDYNLDRVQRFGQSPATPAAPAPDATVTTGALGVSWESVTDPNGESVTYTLERQRGGSVSAVVSAVTDLSHGWTVNDPELEGRSRYRVTASDGKLSSASSWSPEVVVDRTPPVAVPAATRVPEAAPDWYRDDATIGFTGSYDPALPDGSAGSGVDSASRPAAVSRSTSGALSAGGTVSDLAGNVSPQASATVHVDADLPTLALTGSVGGAPYSAGAWTVGPVTVSGECSDAESGVASAPDPEEVAAEGNDLEPQLGCTDHVGHQRLVTFGPIRIDKTAPAPPTATPDRAPDAGDWYRDSVTVTFADAGDLLADAATAGSGVDPLSVPAPVTFSTSGAHLASAAVTDILGHSSSPVSREFRVDADPPELTLSCPSEVPQGQAASGRASATDAQSGIAGASETTIALDTAAAGTHTATASAIDKVGHRRETACTYVVTAPPPSADVPAPTPMPSPDLQPPEPQVARTAVRVRSGAIKLRVSVDETATAAIAVVTRAKIPGRLLGGGRARVVKLAAGSVTLSPPAHTIKLRLSKKMQRLVHRLHKVAVLVTIKARDQAGNSTTKRVKLTLRG